MPISIRQATAADGATVLEMVRGLAEYEGELDKVRLTAAGAEHALAAGHLHALLAFDGPECVAMALYFFNFSSWTGTRGLFVEDLFIRPAARGQRLGHTLFKQMAQIAVAAGCERVEWAVLEENSPAKGFYTKIGGHLAEGWETWRLEYEKLKAFAAG